ncbi:MAG: hypothetical protein JG766_2296 [Desulfacinum sp.]|jgi:hypothetical protein|nr:hypothetical protein [Desulfacinum sp.]
MSLSPGLKPRGYEARRNSSGHGTGKILLPEWIDPSVGFFYQRAPCPRGQFVFGGTDSMPGRRGRTMGIVPHRPGTGEKEVLNGHLFHECRAVPTPPGNAGCNGPSSR